MTSDLGSGDLQPRYCRDSDQVGWEALANLYDGPGVINAKRFAFDRTSAPVRFVIYDIPPGAGEGVHTHRRGDARSGAFDEYYYIIQGQGRMEIDGQIIAVKTGDHVHTPLGVAHGIINTASDESLKVFVTFVRC